VAVAVAVAAAVVVAVESWCDEWHRPSMVRDWQQPAVDVDVDVDADADVWDEYWTAIRGHERPPKRRNLHDL
jgi:hypothetical protein